jgi:hypothetical protein
MIAITQKILAEDTLLKIMKIWEGYEGFTLLT